MIAGMFSVMPNLRRSARQRHVRAMQYEFLFTFQKDIRAGIEYKANAIKSDAATRRSALFLEGSPWKPAGSNRTE
jgi:hypothetical protein